MRLRVSIAFIFSQGCCVLTRFGPLGIINCLSLAVRYGLPPCLPAAVLWCREATIAGGQHNSAHGYSTVHGGQYNVASGM